MLPAEEKQKLSLGVLDTLKSYLYRKDDVGEEEDGGDDKKYCTCRSVSYGNMVACDNDECPYEWFHWSCVGLKSEPAGEWLCPECRKLPKGELAVSK